MCGWKHKHRRHAFISPFLIIYSFVYGHRTYNNFIYLRWNHSIWVQYYCRSWLEIGLLDSGWHARRHNRPYACDKLTRYISLAALQYIWCNIRIPIKREKNESTTKRLWVWPFFFPRCLFLVVQYFVSSYGLLQKLLFKINLVSVYGFMITQRILGLLEPCRNICGRFCSHITMPDGSESIRMERKVLENITLHFLWSENK